MPSSPLTQSIASSALGPPEPHEYNSIIHSIQRRSVDRASTSSSDTSSWRASQDPAFNSSFDSAAAMHDLEADLRLSAQIGQALLEEKGALEKRLLAAEQANTKLLDRLTGSVKESSQLQRRLEEAVGNLEQAESNNRALLVALEEDRKKISRLTADGARLATSATQLKNLTRAHEDTKQELAAEQKRASTAETRVKKQGERVVEMESRLRRAIDDLEEMRQDKVLRNRESHDALAKAKEKFTAGVKDGILANGALGENVEATELLKLVESLMGENEMLRSASVELHELLDSSRDEQSGLRSAIANQGAFFEEDEERDGVTGNLPDGTPTLLSEVLMSPSISNYSDVDRPSSPTSTNPTSFTRSWGPSSNLSSKALGLARTSSSFSTSPGGALDESNRQQYFQHYLPEGRQISSSRVSSAAKRRGGGGGGPGVLTRSTGSTGSVVVPIGRGHARRSMSLDVTVYNRRASGDQSHVLNLHSPKLDSTPNSPRTMYSPSLRPESIASTDDGDPAFRPRRHHRPLSLSLGPSLFPKVPEDGTTDSPPSTAHPRYERHRSSVSISVSNSGDLPYSQPSALSLSSPTRAKRHRIADSIGSDHRVTVTVESSTQTSPPSTPAQASPRGRSNAARMAQRSPSPMGFDTPPPSMSDVSFLGERSVSSDFAVGFGLTVPSGGVGNGGAEARTAMLAALVEQAARLLGRIQSADVASLEKRLKKQNLPGDVRHLAQANLKDLVNDIEGLREHFRRALEHERATLAKDAANIDHSHESLVLRRDFVALVKVFRDLLLETSRLRALVNRVELEPSAASSLRELDALNSLEMDRTPVKASTAGGLLAPLSRLFAGALSAEPEVAAPSPPTPAPRPPPRPIAKLTGSSAVTSATVNVEFGSGAVRRAVTTRPGEEASPTSSPQQSNNKPLNRQKSETQVRRDLSNIFAGGLPPPKSSDPWIVVPPTRSTSSMNPFGRLMAAYRPAPSSTTNAVLDSFSQPAVPETPTLLERQLRPRGLSDSSIRSTFVAHANPQNRLISPATLALSSEVRTEDIVKAKPILLRGQTGDSSHVGSLKDNLSMLSSSMVPSSSVLRNKASQGNLSIKSQTASTKSSVTATSNDDIPPVPPIPISISASPSSPSTTVRPPPSSAAPASPPPTSGSMFTTLSQWASKPSSLAVSSSLAQRDDSWSRRTGA